ncbi:helix-turn-helix transcriptional regulator [Streptomyces sp. NBC_01724]|uniref:helix-turn-helix transcriptional regulator n=1 Tax=unclassified Streptomyces TaxID=2593676 RepID=UPI0028C50EB9|nr:MULTISPECIES: helix-turn-helix transcriptional regulator [unclassified Streptomyces]WNO62720.1 helix-turn-helix transcriptional regulator [Streptomyces sp. AM2-3-1]WTE49590.1 helix-turn-helix transcriptional regulator [Streptomyces sp. NBC_01620]WTE57675.1 helix-turn-helix transcriptional regulator [Streptomyces sp. NBC_01617]
MAREELARFLRERRAGLRPHEIGLPTSTPRRIPGLRREEVAELAHMSVDYYTRLEQARGPRPSPRILDALAQALRLTPAGRSHLFHLAGSSAPPGTNAVQRVRPQVARMLRRLPETGAIVTDAAYGVVAWNPLAQALLGDDLGRGTTNLAQRRFLGQGRMYESSSAEEFGHIVVARLRRAATRYPHDTQLTALLTELRSGSEEFRKIWETCPVHAPGHRTKTLDHPSAGKLRLDCDVLLVPEDDQEVVLMTADPGSPSARTLRRLAARVTRSSGWPDA